MSDEPRQTERPRGRPATRRWPDPIPNTPESVARAIMAGPPKAAGEWRYLREHQAAGKVRQKERRPSAAVTEKAGG